MQSAQLSQVCACVVLLSLIMELVAYPFLFLFFFFLTFPLFVATFLFLIACNNLSTMLHREGSAGAIPAALSTVIREAERNARERR